MNTVATFFFLLFAGVSIVSAVLVVTRRSPLYSALFLAVTLCAQAGLFTLLGAVFVGVIQVLIYAGAILILFLFVIMSLERKESSWVLHSPVVRAISGITVVFLVVQMLYALSRSGSAGRELVLAGGPRGEDHIAVLGGELFTRYLAPFEIGSVLLLVTVLGAVVLARKRGMTEPEAMDSEGAKSEGTEREGKERDVRGRDAGERKVT